MKKTILIIDDDEVFQKALSVKLNSLNYRVISSFDGDDGYNKVVSENPDLVLLDIMLPKINGMDLLRKMRLNKDIQRMPVLMTSNLSEIDFISEGVTLGVKGYIVKSNESIDNVVNQVIDVLNAPAV